MANRKHKVPMWVIHNMGLTTRREYRALKRAQLDQIIKALEDYKLGCAYMPNYDVYNIAEKHLLKAREMISVKGWMR